MTIILTVRSWIALLVFCAATFHAHARQIDTLRISLERADSLFLRQNLFVLSAQYNLSLKDALVIQARAYPNPYFTAAVNAVDPQNDKYFNAGTEGQKEFEIEQLILLGGKRRSSIELAKQDKKIAENELQELLRNLKLQLRSSLFQLNKHLLIISNYDQQLQMLSELIDSYNEQTRLGNVPVKDAIRLKSVFLRISNARIEENALRLEELRKLQLLFRMPVEVVPEVDNQVFEFFQNLPDYPTLLTLAESNRPDLFIAQNEKDRAHLFLRMQRQLAVPDVVMRAGYDQRGGAFQNQVNLGFSIPLPLFDRNRGNIKAASYAEMNAGLMLEQKRAEVQSEVFIAWQNLQACIVQYQEANAAYTEDFTEVFEGMNENFRLRNISILEFVDFFEAYNESLADYHRIRTQLALVAEQINHVTASSIF